MTYEQNDTLVGARMRVVGVGGGGGNAVESMIEARVEGVDFAVANTDAQALRGSRSPTKVQLGNNSTRGLGAGADPEVGRRAAEESASELAALVDGADMVFVTAGMGGGTGTGAAPVVARVAREAGALTVAVVTRPFRFEGGRRARQAREGIEALAAEADALLVVPNDRVLELHAEAGLDEAFRLADGVLVNAVQGISGVIRQLGKINVDFADVRAVMSARGRVLMGIGRARGPDRALRAATEAAESPLLDDVKLDGAMGLLINITGGPDMTLREVNQAAASIEKRVNEDALVIVGSGIDPALEGELRVTVIATGLPLPATRSPQPSLLQPARLQTSATSPATSQSEPSLPRTPYFRASSPPAQAAPLSGQRRFQSTPLAARETRIRPLPPMDTLFGDDSKD